MSVYTTSDTSKPPLTRMGRWSCEFPRVECRHPSKHRLVPHKKGNQSISRDLYSGWMTIIHIYHLLTMAHINTFRPIIFIASLQYPNTFWFSTTKPYYVVGSLFGHQHGPAAVWPWLLLQRRRSMPSRLARHALREIFQHCLVGCPEVAPNFIHILPLKYASFRRHLEVSFFLDTFGCLAFFSSSIIPEQVKSYFHKYWQDDTTMKRPLETQQKPPNNRCFYI